MNSLFGFWNLYTKLSLNFWRLLQVEEHMGHIFKSTQYSIPTYCEYCSSLIWMMDRACVCKCEYLWTYCKSSYINFFKVWEIIVDNLISSLEPNSWVWIIVIICNILFYCFFILPDLLSFLPCWTSNGHMSSHLLFLTSCHSFQYWYWCCSVVYYSVSICLSQEMLLKDDN